MFDGKIPVNAEDWRPRRPRPRKEDFLQHGFADGCRGCQALIAGTAARGHSETCRDRMYKAMENTSEGRKRKEAQTDKENELLAKKLEAEHGDKDEERRQKKAKVEEKTQDVQQASSSSSASGLQDEERKNTDRKRKPEDDSSEW